MDTKCQCSRGVWLIACGNKKAMKNSSFAKERIPSWHIFHGKVNCSNSFYGFMAALLGGLLLHETADEIYYINNDSKF